MIFSYVQNQLVFYVILFLSEEDQLHCIVSDLNRKVDFVLFKQCKVVCFMYFVTENSVTCSSLLSITTDFLFFFDTLLGMLT